MSTPIAGGPSIYLKSGVQGVSGRRVRPHAVTDVRDIAIVDTQAAAKLVTAKLRMELGKTSNVKWSAGMGEYVID
jgi:hypothetical protein